VAAWFDVVVEFRGPETRSRMDVDNVTVLMTLERRGEALQNII